MPIYTDGGCVSAASVYQLWSIRTPLLIYCSQYLYKAAFFMLAKDIPSVPGMMSTIQ